MPEIPKDPSRVERLRRDPRRDLRVWLQRAAVVWQAALGTPAVWVGLLLLLGTFALLPSGFFFAHRATPGSIATRDWVASRDLLLPDEEATRAKQQKAREDVLPLYDFDRGVATDRDRQLAALFGLGRRRLAAPAPDAAPEGQEAAAPGERELAKVLAADTGLEVAPEQAAALARRGFAPALEDRFRRVAQQALRRGIIANKPLLLENRLRGVVLRNLETGAESAHVDLFDHLGYPEELGDFLEAEIGDWPGLAAADRRAAVDLLLGNLRPNLHLNRGETLARQERAVAAIGPVFNQVRHGQVIVRKGDQIDQAAARIIAEMRGDRRARRRMVMPLLGTLVLLGLAGLVLWLGLDREAAAGHGRRRTFGEAVVLLLLSLLGAKFGFLVAAALSNAFEASPLDSAQSWAWAIPFASLALLAGLLLGRNPALLLSFTFAVLAGRFDAEPEWVTAYTVAGSLAAIFTLERYQFKQRLVMLRVGAVVGLANVVVILMLNALSGVERGAMQVAFDLVCGLAGGLLAGAVASFALPVLETLLGITTDIKLVELSNTNLPLLRRLAFEAPGTFQHSLMVANLTKEGCEAIGADAVLAYAGGLYHDVGKVFRPDYFIENQRPGHNRHDKLLPSMSALILINHVKEGAALARQHGLPQPLVDAIEQHHGTRLIKYFYNRALEQSGPDGEVREEKYRYPGPRPQNKVMGVLMLADGIEAASRTLIEPSPAKLRTLIRTIVEDCLRDGQLEMTDLTLSDLRLVAEAFLRVLATIFHQRIDYPGLDFNAEPRRERRPAEAARAS